ncbi:TIM44-like domain-containing protein [Vibrio sp. S17_S38]|uniref:Tim44 domain-containing protein n=1 Tax=Vibrio sp. S17_S38 TaxID=2720229 RepID=UPI0016806671|nr:TIM44-like domain-containing protein [Vibrio sp. S17_S38]MBD1571778.1 TIM44-like domain-containing protein [Vibrio sp. S17_S38]
MKRFLVMMVALVTVTMMSVPSAEAKRFGGGKSFGKSFKTAPAPKQNVQNTNSLNKQPAAANTKRGGMMGGMLGGLLAGGLLASLFMGGGFEGIQFFDILIMAGIAFIAFKLFRGMMSAKQGSMNRGPQAAYSAGAMNRQQFEQPNVQNFEQPQNAGGFGATGQSDVPYNFPPGFDKAAFVEGSREHYRTLQGAWNFNQLETIEEYVSPSLFEQLKEERAQLTGEQHTDVMYVDTEIVRGEYDASKAQLSLQFSGRYRDTVEGIEEDIDEVWHLERDLTAQNAPWLIVGIQTNA